MPGLRDHDPAIIEHFNGWWKRGDAESTPLDHFSQADNIQYFNSGCETRDSIDRWDINVSPLHKVIRMYNYVMQTGPSLLVLVEGGNIYHVIGPTMRYGPILTIPPMEDFGFVAINGRAYITPFKKYTNPIGNPANPATVSYELGLQNQFVYVYQGDGVPARKAAGFPPSNTTPPNLVPPTNAKIPLIANNAMATGRVTEGVHVIRVGFNNGPLIEAYPAIIAPGDKQIQLINIPPNPGGTRSIAMTKAIKLEEFSSNPATHTYYRAYDLLVPFDTISSLTFDVPDSDLLVEYTPLAGTAPPSDGLKVSNTHLPGFCDFGFHLVAVVYETDTGYLTAPGPENFGGNTYIDTTKSILIENIPVSPDSFVKKRHLVSTKAIPEYNGDQKGYQFFFIPQGEIKNNTETAKLVSYYDADLLDDASHLIDNFSEIPAGVNLNTYHSRMVIVGEYGTTESLEGIVAPQVDNRSIARLSAAGEPEAINKVDGLIIVPLDGNPLTNCQEFRDILYLFKKTRTFAYADNQDEPASWQEEVIDQGVGCPVHGLAAVLDSGGVNIDYLLMADWSGLMLFNGTYARPELSWKIEDYWMSLSRNDFRNIQVVNDSITKKIWLTLPTPIQNHVLLCDYGNGLDAKNVRWAKWIYDVTVSSLCLLETNRLILGALNNAVTIATDCSGIYFVDNKAITISDKYHQETRKLPDPTIRTALIGE